MEGFEGSAPFQYWEMIENGNTYLYVSWIIVVYGELNIVEKALRCDQMSQQ